VFTMAKIINTSGKRKTAIARATLKVGKGMIRVNSVPLETYGNDVTRMKISEPLLLVPNAIHGIDVIIDVAGGGVMGQAEAVRTALARGIIQWHNDPQMKDIYLTYDRTKQRNRTVVEHVRNSKSLIVKLKDMMRGKKS
jgi:small subunit ribosomal protein S9